jgi:uncharacterized RDD family membrane protein YckC
MITEEINYADFSQRFFARLIDAALVTLATWGFVDTFIHSNHMTYYPNSNHTLKVFGCVLFYLFYYPILESSGGTVGKRILSIQSVCATTLKPISIGQAYKRSLFISWPLWIMVIISIVSSNLDFYAGMTSYFLTAMLLLFGIGSPLAILWTKYRQGWHDSWANTFVISTKQSA